MSLVEELADLQADPGKRWFWTRCGRFVAMYSRADLGGFVHSLGRGKTTYHHPVTFTDFMATQRKLGRRFFENPMLPNLLRQQLLAAGHGMPINPAASVPHIQR